MAIEVAQDNDAPGDWALELGPLQQGDVELLEDAAAALRRNASTLAREHALHGLERRIAAAKELGTTPRACSTCAHWESHRKTHGDKSLCLSKRLDDRSTPAGAFVLAEERDGSASFLVTGPEFGCAHHTPKVAA